MHAMKAGACRPRPGGGFILVYTLWTLAAAAMLLAMLPKLGAGKLDAGQISAAVEQRQIVNALDYVLRYSRNFNADLDPRLQGFNRLQQESAVRKAKSDNRLAILQALLDSMNFKVTLPDPSKNKDNNSATQGVAEDAAYQQAGSASDLGTGNQNAIYVQRKEPYKLKLGEVEFVVRVTPVNSRPNLNLIQPKALVRYLVYLGLEARAAQGLADVVKDWTDSDDETSPLGAEKDYYNRLYPPYPPRNSPLRTWAETAYLKDADAGLVRFLRQNFSLQGGAAAVLASQVPAKAIAALSNLPLSTVEAIIRNHEEEKKKKDIAVASIVALDDLKLFNEAATWAETSGLSRIRIESPHAAVEAVYDAKNNQLIEWWIE